jgi:carboxylesterase type B
LNELLPRVALQPPQELNQMALVTLVALAAASSPTCIDCEPSATYTLTSGDLVGDTYSTTSEYAGVRQFLGIPFAAPPVGDLRWRPPQPLKPWTGVKKATTYMPNCPQHFGKWTGEESCLFLNVFAPPTSNCKDGARCAVQVWIHGGAYTTGGAGPPSAYYNGTRNVALAKNVIIVAIQ